MSLGDNIVETLECRVLTRKCIKSNRSIWVGNIEYLICVGMSAGKWSSYFGPHCCADTVDCKSIQDAAFESSPHSEGMTHYGYYEFHNYVIQKK